MDQLPEDLQRALDGLPDGLLLEQLPDDVLLSVMIYLDVPSLLQCRLVCRRLDTLALHPDVWRHRILADTDPCFRVALRLAPRLDAMDVCVPLPEALRRLVLTTACRVSVLCLQLGDDEDGGYVAQAAQLIRHQSGLGQLIGVYVSFSQSEAAPLQAPIASELFGTLASTPGLREVSIVESTSQSRFPVDTSTPAPQHTIAPSLLFFECIPMPPGLTEFCDLMLTRNATTLEEVTVNHGFTLPTPSQVCALGRMPRLEKMSCDTFDGMDALAACPSLRSLDLNVWSAPEEAAELLRSAYQLTWVSLYYATYDLHDVHLITALASSGKSHLNELIVMDYRNRNEDGSFPQLQELLRALPRLPALRKLEVRTKTKELLLDVGPNTAEELRSHFS